MDIPFRTRLAYYLSAPLVDLTLYLWGRWNVPLAWNRPGWNLVAYHYGVCDRLVHGVYRSRVQAVQS